MTETTTDNPGAAASDPRNGPSPVLTQAMESVDLADVQGNLIRGYNMLSVRHIVVEVVNATAARRFISDTVTGADGVHQLTRASVWDNKPQSCLNVGVSASGLRALGMNDASLSSFPEEFLDGSTERAVKIGDVDDSAPEHWRDGFDDPAKVHLMWTVHGVDAASLERVCAELIEQWTASNAFRVTSSLDGTKLPDPASGEPCHDVHFGYRDSISQPRFRVVGAGPNDIIGPVSDEPVTPIGALLLGYRVTSFHNVQWQMPTLKADRHDEGKPIGKNGCFQAFRVLEQDVDLFEDFLEQQGAELGWNKEYLAAKLMGRWRNGVPIVLTPDDKWKEPGAGEPSFAEVETEDGREMTDKLLNDFDYPDHRQGAHDLEGRPCPIGAHIRRANPRDSRIVQRSANHTRPIVRRGMPYGPPFDPNNRGDGERRGLLGSFFCASLISQFEAMMYDWINLGLIDPTITGTNCPIIGANKPESSSFDIRIDENETITIRGIPRFVETVGSAYLFHPSISALRVLAEL